MADKAEQGEQSPEEATQDFEVVTDEAVDRSEEPEGEQPSNAGEASDQEDKGEESAKAQQDNEDDNGEQDDDADEKDDNADNADEAGAETKPPKKARFQKRIDRLTKRASEAERRAEEAERKLREAQQGGKGAKADSEPKGEEPDPNDYDDYNEYLDALSEWKAGKSDERNDDNAKNDKDKGKGDKKKDKEPESDPEFEEALADVQEAFEETRGKHKDFDDVVGAKDLAITSDMVKAMADSEDPGEIAYYLGKHKEEARHIAGLSALQQAKEIGKLEAKLAVQPNKQPSKKVTSAPDPIEPVGGNANSSQKDVRDMSFDEYEQARNEQEQRRGGFW